MEVNPPVGNDEKAHKDSVEKEAAVAKYGVLEWTERFLQTLQENRQAHGTSERPIFFVCHSTGGIVVKHAMTQRPLEVAAVCIGVTFFATPHRTYILQCFSPDSQRSLGRQTLVWSNRLLFAL